jgi:hypothetical protein
LEYNTLDDDDNLLGVAYLVEEADGEAELVGHLADVLDGVGAVVVVLQEVEHTLAWGTDPSDM